MRVGPLGPDLFGFCMESIEQILVKPGQVPKYISIPDFKGCPESCGLCPEHQQHTCLPVIEINSDCDLNFWVCLKKSKNLSSYLFHNSPGTYSRVKECEEEVDVINPAAANPP